MSAGLAVGPVAGRAVPNVGACDAGSDRDGPQMTWPTVTGSIQSGDRNSTVTRLTSRIDRSDQGNERRRAASALRNEERLFGDPLVGLGVRERKVRAVLGRA